MNLSKVNAELTLEMQHTCGINSLLTINHISRVCINILNKMIVFV